MLVNWGSLDYILGSLWIDKVTEVTRVPKIIGRNYGYLRTIRG